MKINKEHLTISISVPLSQHFDIYRKNNDIIARVRCNKNVESSTVERFFYNFYVESIKEIQSVIEFRLRNNEDK